MPCARERTIERGIINDTFESRDRARHGRAGQVTCRCTHVYPDGPAPYFTFHAAGRHGELSAQSYTIKSAALDAVIANGGTVRPPSRGRA